MTNTYIPTLTETVIHQNFDNTIRGHMEQIHSGTSPSVYFKEMLEGYTKDQTPYDYEKFRLVHKHIMRNLVRFGYCSGLKPYELILLGQEVYSVEENKTVWDAVLDEIYSSQRRYNYKASVRKKFERKNIHWSTIVRYQLLPLLKDYRAICSLDYIDLATDQIMEHFARQFPDSKIPDAAKEIAEYMIFGR